MALADISPTKEDFEQCEWQEIIAASEEKDCSAYLEPLRERAVEAATRGDTGAEQVFELLYHVCSLMPKLDSPSEPFGPMLVLADRRSAVTDDLSEEYLDALEAIVQTVEDAELQARIADILWCRRRGGHQMAELAVKSYLRAAERLEDPKEWVQSEHRIERAVQLAVSLGKNNRPFGDVIAHIEGVLEKYQGEDPLFLSAKLMTILQDYRQGDPLKYAALAEKAAIRAEAGENGIKWHKARVYWEIKARWHAIAGDEENARKSQICAAETYVEEAEDMLKRPHTPYSVAASFLQQAIGAFRKIKDTQERRRELHKKLLEYQEKSVAELKSYSYSLDIGEFVERAVSLVKGKTLRDSLFVLALAGSSPKVSDLRKRVEGYVRKFAFTYFIPMRTLDKEGKVVGRRPGMYGDESESEQALRAEMYKEAANEQGLFAQAVVGPAMAQINTEHNVRVVDLLSLVSNSPFVPPGREHMFARGLHAGFTGDFVMMAHLLCPQIEYSIRHLLSRRGVDVSGLDDQCIQDVYSLNTTLYKYESELVEILGEDIVFDLQGLLVERFGSNLRNRMAHGLMDYDEFYSWQILYLWWLCLRLCLLPVYLQMHESDHATQDEERAGVAESEVAS